MAAEPGLSPANDALVQAAWKAHDLIVRENRKRNECDGRGQRHPRTLGFDSGYIKVESMSVASSSCVASAEQAATLAALAASRPRSVVGVALHAAVALPIPTTMRCTAAVLVKSEGRREKKKGGLRIRAGC